MIARTYLVLGTSALALCTVPTVVLAQDGSAAERLRTAAAEQINEEAATLMADGSPNDRAMAGFHRPTLNFTTEEGEDAISLAFSFDLNSQTPTRNADNFYNVSRTRINFVATAPIEDDNDFSRLFRGDSLVTGTKLQLSIARLSNRLGTGAAADGSTPLPAIAAAYQQCIRESAGNWALVNDAQPSLVRSFETDLATTRAEVGGSSDIALGELSDSNEGYKDLATAVYRACAPGDDSHRYPDEVALVYGTLGEDISHFFYNESSSLRFMGLDATVGQDSYEYLDRSLFEVVEDDRTSWEVGAYYGIINNDATHSGRLRLVYGRTWELPDEGEDCRTFVGTLEEKCLSGPDGEPTSNETGLISLETRHLFSLTDNDRIAFAPQITYRFEDDNVGVEVPVYLVPDEDGILTGGLKFGYNSDGDEFGIGVFIGVPFNVTW